MYFFCRIVHTQSGGNPGWFETFLNSLIQDGGLRIEEMIVEEALKIGLVFTEPAFMTRKSIVFSRKESELPRIEEWNMFSYCFNVSLSALIHKDSHTFNAKIQLTGYASHISQT